MTEKQLAQARARLASMGRDVSAMSDEDVRNIIAERERRFTEEAPTSAAEVCRRLLRTRKENIASRTIPRIAIAMMNRTWKIWRSSYQPCARATDLSESVNQVCRSSCLLKPSSVSKMASPNQIMGWVE